MASSGSSGLDHKSNQSPRNFRYGDLSELFKEHLSLINDPELDSSVDFSALCCYVGRNRSG